MHVVIATAEPRGAYHLHALRSAMAASGHQFTHLVPYDEPVQGRPLERTSAELSDLLGADRLVITGGSLSAWTHAVAAYANQCDTPVTFSELAFVPTDACTLGLPRLEAVSAVSASGARALANYLSRPIETINILGNPLLDHMPSRELTSQTILIVSTDQAHSVDRKHQLRGLARELRDAGRPVLVAPHAREDTTYWAGFDIATVPAYQAAARARVAVGYLGSAAPMIAATGCPFVVLDPQGDRRNLEEWHREATSGWARTADEARALLETAAPVPAHLVERVTGPIGGAAQRVVDFWTR